MKYNPATADNNPTELLPAGVYAFRCEGAEDKLSTNGNDMIELTLNVNGKKKVWDNLVALDSMTWKIKHFFESCGMIEHFEKGEIKPVNCKGKTGLCRIKIEKGKNGKERNVVDDYVTEIYTDVDDDKIGF